jgi:Tol biopolymer transport system component
MEIYVMNADGTGQTRLTNNTLTDLDPSFSPDGSMIVFSSQVVGGGALQIVVMNANGTNQSQLTSSGVNTSPAFSPDGTQITFNSNRDAFNLEIYVMNAMRKAS